MAGDKIAYLAGQYPAVSHTFILREVLALRDLGLDVVTCSVQSTGVEHHRGPDEAAAAQETFVVQREAFRVWSLIAAQKAAFTTPARYFGALGLALSWRMPGLKSLLFQVFYFAEATVLARHLIDSNVTHLHSHFSQAGTSVAALAAEIAHIPFSFTLHGPADLDAPLYWSVPQKVSRARFVACISNYARSQLMRICEPDDWDKLKIVHCGVQPETYVTPDQSQQTPAGLRLLFIGRLSAVKGVRILIDAMSNILQVHPDTKLTVIGDGPDRSVLTDKSAPLGDAVTFLGYQSQAEVAQALQETDMLVLPSFAEGVPVVLMEAMAAAKPVVCTQVAGVSELVAHGESGLIVPPGDTDALAAAIIALAEDKDRRDRMGQMGREMVVANFDASKEARKLADLLRGD